MKNYKYAQIGKGKIRLTILSINPSKVIPGGVNKGMNDDKNTVEVKSRPTKIQIRFKRPHLGGQKKKRQHCIPKPHSGCKTYWKKHRGLWFLWYLTADNKLFFEETVLLQDEGSHWPKAHKWYSLKSKWRYFWHYVDSKNFSFYFQIPPESSVHRYWHPSRRWCGRGFLHYRPCHDRVLPQVWRVLPWHRWPQGRSLMNTFQNVSVVMQPVDICFVICRTSELERANITLWITRWGMGLTMSPMKPYLSLWVKKTIVNFCTLTFL